MTAQPEKYDWFTASELAERDARIRAEVAERIALRLEAEADDEATRPGRRDPVSAAIEEWLREAARIAREHAAMPAHSAQDATNPPNPSTTTPGDPKPAMAVSVVAGALWVQARKLRDGYRTSGRSIDYINGYEDASAFVEQMAGPDPAKAV